MGNLFAGPHIWVVLAIIILLFGATRLPALARSLGQSTKIFRNEMKSDEPKDAADPTVVDSTTAPVPPATTSAPVTPTAPGSPTFPDTSSAASDKK